MARVSNIAGWNAGLNNTSAGGLAKLGLLKLLLLLSRRLRPGPLLTGPSLLATWAS